MLIYISILRIIFISEFLKKSDTRIFKFIKKISDLCNFVICIFLKKINKFIIILIIVIIEKIANIITKF